MSSTEKHQPESKPVYRVHYAWRSIVVGLLVAALAFGILRTAVPRMIQPSQPPVTYDPQHTPLDALLDAEIDSLNFDQTPLEDVLKQLSLRGHIAIEPHWAALARGALEPSTPVTLHFKHIKVRRAFDLILKSTDPIGPCGWEERDNVIVISRQSELDKYDLVTCVYDVSVLVRIIARDPALLGSTYTIPTFSSSVIGAPADLDQESVAELKKCLIDNVDPESWKDNGGDNGSVTSVHLKLVVVQTRRNQQQIAWLLKSLQE